MPPRIVTVDTPAPAVRLIYDFVSPAEESYIIEKVSAVGGDSSKLWGWKELNGRRSMYWGGTVTPSATLIPAPFPSFMDSAWPNVLERITDTGAFDVFGVDAKGKKKAPNHCLVNEYLPGQGIMAHTDGPAYSPLVSTLSLGSHSILTLRPRRSHTNPSTSNSTSPPTELTPEPSTSTTLPPLTAPSPPNADDPPPLSIFLPARSLILLSEELYSDWMHGIEADIKLDTMDSLRACANWESFWEAGGGMLDELMGSAGGEVGSGSTPMDKKQAIEALVARRRIAEAGQGWERGTRLSLTCRRVDKVRKGIKLG
ncbi:hypothetical protein BCR35DRAFT_332817 [Leucosporidium creatinivorum]|uniref:Fe2OG dioxygenase domain-containing protein n=1 Tax=Leucosporidium creatinivorum TaxID=106004 RepID=A0A1Y2EY62_9BASI|nr:hypothetical protein BCR35DRAFT_332817 [Leucosporidium creatinivorum]